MDEQLQQLQDEQPELFGMTSSQRMTHGGTTGALFFMLFIESERLAAKIRSHVFVDAGCGVGHLGRAVLDQFGENTTYWGFDISQARVDVANANFARDAELDVSKRGRARADVIDMTTAVDEAAKWSALIHDKCFIYFNNINMIGEVNECFERIVIQYACAGTIVMAYERMFLGDRASYVDLVKTAAVDVGEDDFTWRRSAGTMNIYIYRVLRK